MRRAGFFAGSLLGGTSVNGRLRANDEARRCGAPFFDTLYVEYSRPILNRCVPNLRSKPAKHIRNELARLVLRSVNNFHYVQPFVVSLSNHERLYRRPFDRAQGRLRQAQAERVLSNYLRNTTRGGPALTR